MSRSSILILAIFSLGCLPDLNSDDSGDLDSGAFYDDTGDTDTDVEDTDDDWWLSVDDCSDDYPGEGWEVGGVIEDVTWEDQLEREVRLHNFCDHAYVLVFTSEANPNPNLNDMLGLWREFEEDRLRFVIATYDSSNDYQTALADFYEKEFPVLGMDTLEAVEAIYPRNVFLVRDRARIYKSAVYADITDDDMLELLRFSR